MLAIVLPLLLATVGSLLAAGIALGRRSTAGRVPFAWLMLAIALWSMLSALHASIVETSTRITLAKLQYLAIPAAPLLWFLVAHRASGHASLHHRLIMALAAVPALTLAAAWTNDWHGWLWADITPAGPALVYHHGPWFWVAAAYNYALLAGALALLVRGFRHTPAVFHAQLRVIIVAACLPWVGNALYLTRAISIPGLDPTPLAFALTGMLFLWALTRHQFLRLVPIARSVVLDHMRDGVLVLDAGHHIVDFNPAAARLAGLATSGLGQPLERACPIWSEVIRPRLAPDSAPMVVTGAISSVELSVTMLPGVPGRPDGWLVTLRDITAEQEAKAARKALEEQLRAERDFARQVMQTMGEGLTVTDATGRFTFVNDAYTRLLGYAPADLIGRSPFDVTVAEDHASLQGAREARARGERSTYLSQLRHADGSVVEVQITGVPRVIDGQVAGAVAVITDLRERLAVETQLRAAEQTLRSFFNSAGVMMGIVELLDDDILHITDNAVAADFFGTTPPAMAEQRASALGALPEVIARWLAAYRDSVATGQPAQFTYAHDTGCGERWLAATVCVIGPAPSGRSRCTYVVADITPLREAETERLELERQLFEVQRRESIGTLAGGIAHDFNNLLMGVLGHAELLQLDLPHGSPLHASVQSIIVGAHEAADLTRQLLAYAGKGRYTLQPVQLNELILGLSDLLRAALPPNTEVRYQLAPVLPPLVADATQLRQVVLNLLLNAAEASERGDATIDVETALVAHDAAYLATLPRGAEITGAYVRLTVRDTGCGMDAETQAHMFEPFFTTKFMGRGLGLAAVHGIVRGHGGVIQVSSVLGAGTTLTVVLPADSAPTPLVTPPRQAATMPESRSAPEPPTRQRPASKPAAVLVIDDEQAVREVARRMLERLGLCVLEAGQGAEALALLEADEHHVVAVLLDLTMPEMSGAEVAAQIVQPYPQLPVIVMSGYSAEEVDRQVGSLPLAGRLQKPFTIEGLRSCFASLSTTAV